MSASSRTTSGQTRSRRPEEHRGSPSADELMLSSDASAGLPLSISNSDCFDATPAALCLDDSYSSNDSVHQFLLKDVSGGRMLLPQTPSNVDDDDDDNEDELMMLGTTSPYDRPIRTRPPSPRRPIAVTIPFRSIASVPAAATATEAEASAARSRRSKKRQTGNWQQSAFSAASYSSTEDNEEEELTAGRPDEEESLKRRRVATPLGDASNLPSAMFAKPSLGRCMSESCHLDRVSSSTRIDKAIASIDSLNLIGNSEQTHSLPTVKSLDFGIRSVTPATLAGLLAGQFSDSVANYVIVDCRYPFEYDGGHIRSAINLYRPEVLLNRLLPAVGCIPSPSNQVAIIFHCEFSSQRAPKMARLLRQRDREVNADNYPQLHYPEIYLLQGGYKAFYEEQPADCEPQGYTKMCDPNYSQQLTHFDKLSRAWERQNSRSKHSRLKRLAGSPQLS